MLATTFLLDKDKKNLGHGHQLLCLGMLTNSVQSRWGYVNVLPWSFILRGVCNVPLANGLEEEGPTVWLGSFYW